MVLVEQCAAADRIGDELPPPPSADPGHDLDLALGFLLPALRGCAGGCIIDDTNVVLHVSLAGYRVQTAPYILRTVPAGHHDFKAHSHVPRSRTHLAGPASGAANCRRADPNEKLSRRLESRQRARAILRDIHFNSTGSTSELSA